MAKIEELYQETILEHSQQPRNFGKIKKADYFAEGFNPLCGDHYWVYIKIDPVRNSKGSDYTNSLRGKQPKISNGVNHKTIKDITFEGNGCALSRASASLMTEALEGKKIKEAIKIFQDFQKLVKGEKLSSKIPPKLSVFSGISRFPLRVKCVLLPWQTMKSAILKEKFATTEDD